MKRTLCIVFALLFVIMLGGCSAKDKEVSSGIYYCKGDYEQYKTPYVWVDTSDGFFTMGEGTTSTNVLTGSFTVEEDRLIATASPYTLIFEIKGSKTLVLTDSENFTLFKLPEDAKFILSDDLDNVE